MYVIHVDLDASFGANAGKLHIYLRMHKGRFCVGRKKILVVGAI
jgi:hypothetical protein